MVCLTSCGSQGLPVYTVGARGWHPDRGLSRVGLSGDSRGSDGNPDDGRAGPPTRVSVKLALL